MGKTIITLSRNICSRLCRSTGERHEIGNDAHTGKQLVAIDPRHFRPTEVDLLLGDCRKATEKLGWTHQTTLDDLVAEMVREDLKIMARSVPPARRTNLDLMHA